MSQLVVAAHLAALALATSTPPRSGLLVVGLAGNNGVTLLGGQLAHQRGLVWESARDGPKAAQCNGCITQVGGLAKSFAFAPFDELAVGGWDVVPTPLGDALYESRVLDYDLVRQVRDEMNGMSVLPGVWDADFYGESQHAGATNIVPETTRASQLERLRSDIRTFKAEQRICTDGGEDSGHVTVVWSASVERPCEEYGTAAELMDAIAADDKPNVSPSLVYAAAAVLEGCSFVNGGSQNTIQPALLELASCRGAYDGDASGGEPYVLGTDFKAGQTKAKTAIVEYLRALGLRPRTIASYNHLGNNDMKNLLSPRTWTAKARVKTDVFGPWMEEDAADGVPPIDHKVAVLYTEQMGDEKRDTVEYTSEAFMGCEHTMLTYTRCMDSALCVPLMIDAAILCDYLIARDAPPAAAATALAYLFKLNEGAAVGVDPGFFNQSAALRSLLDRLPADPLPTTTSSASTGVGGGEVIGGVLCAGLSCIDMQLLRAATPTSREAIARFNGFDVTAGGSTSNTASALRALGVDAAVLTIAGDDFHGDELERIYADEGIDTTLLVRKAEVTTALAVLPVFEEGGRGCWVDLSANDQLTPEAMLGALREPSAAGLRRSVRAVHVGYPHLLSGLQGDALREWLRDAATLLSSDSEDGEEADLRGGPLLSVDVNGATLGAFADADRVLGPAYPLIDMLHANLEEACHVTGVTPAPEEADASVETLRALVAPLLASGVAVVAITLGANGAFVAVTEDAERLRRTDALAQGAAAWRGAHVLLPALPVDGEVNANGAGDAFTAGLLAAMLFREEGAQRPLSLEAAVGVALGAARQRVDSARRSKPESVGELSRA